MSKENKFLREVADAIVTAYTSGTEVGELLRRFERLANEELCVYCRESDSRSSFVNLNALRACGTKFMGLLKKPDVKVSQQDQWNEHWTAQRQHHAQFFRILYVCLMSSLLSASETSGAQFPKTNMLTNLADLRQEGKGGFQLVFDTFDERFGSDTELTYWWESCVSANVLMHENSPQDVASAVKRIKGRLQTLHGLSRQRITTPVDDVQIPIDGILVPVGAAASFGLNLACNVSNYVKYHVESGWHKVALAIRIATEACLAPRQTQQSDRLLAWRLLVSHELNSQERLLPWQVFYTIAHCIARIVLHPTTRCEEHAFLLLSGDDGVTKLGHQGQEQEQKQERYKAIWFVLSLAGC